MGGRKTKLPLRHTYMIIQYWIIDIKLHVVL